MDKMKIETGMDPENCQAATEIKDVFDFTWKIKQIRQLLENQDQEAKLLSPSFTEASYMQFKNKLEWQIEIRWNYKEKKWYKPGGGTRYLSVYLYLLSGENSSKFSFQCNVMDAKKSIMIDVSENMKEMISGNESGWAYPKFVEVKDLLKEHTKLLEDNTLRLRFLIKQHRADGRWIPKAESGGKVLSEENNFYFQFSSLFDSPHLTDVSIQTKNSTLKAHKVVLAGRSPVFSAMFLSGMSEATDGRVDIMDFSDVIVKEMLKYIYCGKVSLDNLVENCVDLFLIAEKYDIKGLKEETGEFIAENLSVDNVLDSLTLADINCSMSLRSKAIKFINMNKHSMTEAGFQKICSYNPELAKELYQSP